MPYSNSSNMIIPFGVTGLLTTAHFMTPGSGASTADDTRLTIPVACRFAEWRMTVGTVPGAGVTDTYTLNVNGVASAATIAIGPAATTGTWSGAIAIAADDEISISVASAGGVTAAQNIAATLLFQVQI